MQRSPLLTAKVLDQVRDVLTPLVQPRQLELEYRQAVVQVFAKAFLGHQALEVTVGSRHHPAAEVPALAATERPVLPGFQHTQQLRLQGQWQFADLVEEQCARAGHLQVAHALANRAGERAAGMAKQFGFEQLLGDRPTVEVDEWFARRAQAVQLLGDDFLAGPGRAEDQHRAVALRHPSQQGV
ncbi:hypothetical protein D3C76_774130 [compost metagenome]